MQRETESEREGAIICVCARECDIFLNCKAKKKKIESICFVMKQRNNHD